MIWRNKTEFNKYIKEHHIDNLKDIVGKTVKDVTSNDIIIFTDGTFIALDVIHDYDTHEIRGHSDNICLYDLMYLGISSQKEVEEMYKTFDKQFRKNRKQQEKQQLKEKA